MASIFSKKISRRVLRFLFWYSASAKVNWLMIRLAGLKNGRCGYYRKKWRVIQRLLNLFSNHLFYWGDEHYEMTIGPERAERMNACRTALEHDVPLAIHSDAPVTPMGPLFTAWCAVNRVTASGLLLGEYEQLTMS